MRETYQDDVVDGGVDVVVDVEAAGAGAAGVFEESVVEVVVDVELEVELDELDEPRLSVL